MNITTATPKEIDFKISEIYDRFYKALGEANVARGYLASTLRFPPKPGTPQYRVDQHNESVAKYEAMIEERDAIATAILAETAPYDAEFRARGGWTRAFLVTNAGGHVHNTMRCSSCFATTQFAWLPEYSGDSEEIMVEDAGESCCTICFPSAPVDVLNRPSKIELPERKAARLEREKAKAERDAKKLATGILTPEGEEVRIPSSFSWGARGELVKSARTAETKAVDYLVVVKLAEAGCLDEPHFFEGYREREVKEATECLEILIPALAAKRGVTEDEFREGVTKKVEGKYKKDYRSQN